MAGDSGVNTYVIRLHCNNCGDLKEYEIEKGVRVSSVECENCGLKSMVREAWVNYRQRKLFLKTGMEKDEDDE